MSIRIKAERASLQAETPVRVQEQNLNASVEEKDTTEIPIVDTTITEDAGEENSVIRRRSTSAEEDLASESDVDAEPSPLKRIKSEGRQVIKKEKIVHLSALQLREVQKSLASLRKKRYDQKYRREWENTFNWVARSKKSELCFYCKICQRDYYGGSTELMRHEVTRKHENNAKKDSEQISRNITFVYKNSSPNNLPTVDLTDEPDGSENDESHFIVSDPTKKRRRTEVIMDVKMEVKATSKMRESAPSRFDVKPKLKSPIVMRTEKVLMPFNTAKLRKMQAVTPFYSAEGYKSPSPKSQVMVEVPAPWKSMCEMRIAEISQNVHDFC